LKQIIYIVSLIFLFSCSPDPSKEAVNRLLKAFEKENIESIRIMVPQYSDLQEGEIIQLCRDMEAYYRNPKIEITPVDEQSFSAKLESPRNKGVILNFTMKKNTEGSYYLSEGFTLSRHIDFVPGN